MRGVRPFATSRGEPRGFRALIPPTAWANLVQAGVRRVYHRGSPLLIQGDPGQFVVALVNGRVKALYAEPDGREVLVAVRGPGDLLGEFARTDHGPRSATVIALEPAIAYVISDAKFTASVRRYGIAEQLDRYMVAKIRETAAYTWRLAHRRPAERLAGLLLDIVEAAGPDHPDPLTVPMSQEELAAGLGLARSSITPVLADWKRRGLIRIARSRITVTDLEHLRRYALDG